MYGHVNARLAANTTEVSVKGFSCRREKPVVKLSVHVHTAGADRALAV